MAILTTLILKRNKINKTINTKTQQIRFFGELWSVSFKISE